MHTILQFAAVACTRSFRSASFGSVLHALICLLLSYGAARLTAYGATVGGPVVMPTSDSDSRLEAHADNSSSALPTDERLTIHLTETNSVVVTWSTNLPPARLLSRVGRFVFENIAPAEAGFVRCDESPVDPWVVCYSAAWERVDALVTITPQGRYQVIAPVRLESQFYRLELLGPLERSTWAVSMLEGALIKWPQPVTVWFSAGEKARPGCWQWIPWRL